MNTQDSSLHSKPNASENSSVSARAQMLKPRGIKSWLAALGVLILLGFSGYALLTPLFDKPAAADSGAPGSNLNTNTPQNADIESLKARFSDAQKVNADRKSVV